MLSDPKNSSELYLGAEKFDCVVFVHLLIITYLISDSQFNRSNQCQSGVRMETIGKRIKRLRIDRGFKRQSDLGDIVGISQATMSGIESKDQDFSGRDLMSLSRALMVSPEYIIFGGEEEDMGVIEIMQIYKSLPLVEREMLLKMARGLKPDQANRMSA